jgi:AAA+ ATPase superfamily predicted ATPase
VTSREPNLAEFVVIIGGRSSGKTGIRMAILDALATGRLVLIKDVARGQGTALHLRTACDIPPAPPATPFWSADYRNKRGRR